MKFKNTSFKSINCFFLKNKFKTINFSLLTHPDNAKLSFTKKFIGLLKFIH